MSTPPRPHIDLEMIGIRLGNVLSLYGQPGILCVVTRLYPSEVRYDGQLLSLSGAASAATGTDANGPQLWTYQGETLSERRNRFRDWHTD